MIKNEQPAYAPAAQLDGPTMTYADYLCLERLLTAQRPLTDPVAHDELFFIVFHQVTELWFTVLLHELDAVRDHLSGHRIRRCLDGFTRVHRIQVQIVTQWSVMETLTSESFADIRRVLGSASGLHSAQYRALEALLGGRTQGTYRRPSLFDEFVRYLDRRGHPIPRRCVERDWTQPRTRDAELIEALRAVQATHGAPTDDHLLWQHFTTLDFTLRAWRRRHLHAVRRLIGDQRGTGGTAGAGYLERSLDRPYFPELLEAAR